MKRYVGLILCYLTITFPFLGTILFSVATNDDFTRAISLSGNIFKSSIDIANSMWISWGGVWTLYFLQGVLHPFRVFKSYGHGVGLELVVFFIVFSILIYLFIKSILKRYFGITREIIVDSAFLIFIVVLLNSNVYTEIFYWYVGSTYLIEVILALLNILLIFRMFDNEIRCKDIIITSIVGFFACFGYQAALFSGIIYLYEIYIFYHNHSRKINIKHFVSLIAMVIGGLVAVAAPGNYVRHDFLDNTGLHGIKALFDSANVFIGLIINTLTNPIYIIMMIVLIVIGVKYVNNKVKINYGLLFIIAICNVWGVIFPISLGYSSDFIPNRMWFLIYFYAILWELILSLSLGGVIREKYSDVTNNVINNSSIIVSMCVLTLVVVMSGGVVDETGKTVRIETIPYVRTMEKFENVVEESHYIRAIYKNLSMSNEEDVVVVHDDFNAPLRSGIIFPLCISEDENNWVNVAVAQFFNKKSVKLECVYHEPWEYNQ